MHRRVLIAIGAVLLLAGSLAAACGTDTDDLEDRIAALEQQASLAEEISALHEQVQRASMVATLNVLDDVGFHELNQAIAADGVAPSGSVGSIRTALRAVAAIDWPDELDVGAQEFQVKLQTFLDALLEESDALVDTALPAHDGYHDFSDRGWTYLGETAGLSDSGEGDDHEQMGGMENATPTP